MHSKLPYVLIQYACVSQLCCPVAHSSISKDKDRFEIRSDMILIEITLNMIISALKLKSKKVWLFITKSHSKDKVHFPMPDVSYIGIISKHSVHFSMPDTPYIGIH